MATLEGAMKVFVAGASGAIGRPLIEQLTRGGHEVTGMVRSASGADRLRQLGAEPIQVDAFDRDAVRAALERAKPAVVIDQLTSLPKSPADLAKARPPPPPSTSPPPYQKPQPPSQRPSPLTESFVWRAAVPCLPQRGSGACSDTFSSRVVSTWLQRTGLPTSRLRCALMRPVA